MGTSMMSVDLVMVTAVDTVVPDAGVMTSVKDMVIAVSISTCYAPLMLNKLEDLELKLLPNKTKDLETTTENLLNTKMDPALDLVVDMVMVAGVTLSVSGMVIAVVMGMMSVDLVMETVVVTVVPDAGAILSVPVMVIAVLISTTYVDLSVVPVVDLVVVMLTDVGVMLNVSTMVIAVVISMMSAVPVMETVVVTVVPDVGAMMSVPHMVIAVLITTCFAERKIKELTEFILL